MLASPPLRGLRDRFAHPYQTWYECAVKATTIYQQGAMLAPIRLTNAAAQLVLRTQVRRKETHPLPTSTPLPPLRGLRDRFAHPYQTWKKRLCIIISQGSRNASDAGRPSRPCKDTPYLSCPTTLHHCMRYQPRDPGCFPTS